MRRILVVLVGGVLLMSGCGVTTKDANHSGYITAVEKNGIIWKTGQVYVKSELSSSQEDSYCVEDEIVYNELKEAAKNKQRVNLIYHSELVTAPWRCEGDTIVDKVEKL